MSSNNQEIIDVVVGSIFTIGSIIYLFRATADYDKYVLKEELKYTKEECAILRSTLSRIANPPYKQLKNYGEELSEIQLINVAFIGPEFSGKTSLIKSLMYEPVSTGYENTTKTTIYSSKDSIFRLWDINCENSHEYANAIYFAQMVVIVVQTPEDIPFCREFVNEKYIGFSNKNLNKVICNNDVNAELTELFGKLLFVVNKNDLAYTEKTVELLEEEFPGVSKVYTTSAITGKGISELRRAIHL